MRMLANVTHQWRYRVTNFWLVTTCGLCSNPPENNGYYDQDEAKKVIDILHVHLGPKNKAKSCQRCIINSKRTKEMLESAKVCQGLSILNAISVVNLVFYNEQC